MKGIWLDDERSVPKIYRHMDLVHVKTAREAINLIKKGEVEFISLDHDLGDEKIAGTGYDVALFIEKQAFLGSMPRIGWNVHTANPVARVKMLQALKNADRYWSEQGTA